MALWLHEPYAASHFALFACTSGDSGSLWLGGAEAPAPVAASDRSFRSFFDRPSLATLTKSDDFLNMDESKTRCCRGFVAASRR